ncbi:MAG: peptidylprolyl isomerase [Halothiobacillaceae bacterium]
MQIAQDAVVSIDYTLTNSAGDVLDSSEGRQPLAYLHGHGNIIPGLETALEGKTAGEALEVTVPPAEAYGERDESLIQTVPSSLFQGVDTIEPGMRFQAQTGAGVEIVVVKAVEGDQITLDANHELAGETLNFKVSIVEVREATPEEIDHGHVHGPGGIEH